MKQTLTLLALFVCLSLSAQDTTCPTMIADEHEQILPNNTYAPGAYGWVVI